MRTLDRLKREARQAAEWRGHTLARFRQLRRRCGAGFFYYDCHAAACSQCGMSVTVRQRPAPNEIDICGEAVALNCKGAM